MGETRDVPAPAALRAVIFDTDGVITDTAVVHAAAWKRLFDEFLAGRGEREGRSFEPFDEVREYLVGEGLMIQKVPEQLEVVDALPRNPTGKVLKHQLKETFGA